MTEKVTAPGSALPEDVLTTPELLARIDERLKGHALECDVCEEVRGQFDGCEDAALLRAAAYALGQSSRWQPIETAPTGGPVTEVLLCWDDGIAAPRFKVGYNLGDVRRWQDTHQWLHNEHSWPTHWMPLPAPPASAAPRTEGEEKD